MLDLRARSAGRARPDLRRRRGPVVPPRFLPLDEDEPADVFAAMRRRRARPPPAELHGERRTPRRAGGRRSGRPRHQADAVPDFARLARGPSPDPDAERSKQSWSWSRSRHASTRGNIEWARKLEQAGAHVVYGLIGLKTHQDAARVRREATLRRYPIGAGNYNTGPRDPSTRAVHLQARDRRRSDLFNILTGLSRQRTFRRLIVAPTGLRERFLQLVGARPSTRSPAARQDRAEDECPHRRRLRRSALPASTAGVDVDLIIRGACARAGCREAVRADPRPLHHRRVPRAPRIWRFENAPARMADRSGDLMDRNLTGRSRPSSDPDPEAQRLLDENLAALWPTTGAPGHSARGTEHRDPARRPGHRRPA